MPPRVRRARRRVPLRTQVEQADCGSACLAMVLARFGCHVPLEEVRARIGDGRDGTSAATLVTAANDYGLVSRVFRGPPDTLPDLPTGTIMLWRHSHYVVFERASGDAVVLVDPSLGRRRIPMAEAQDAYTGIVVISEPGPGFQRRRRRHSPFLRQAVRTALPARRLAVIVGLSALLRIAALALPLATSVVVDKAIPRSDTKLLVGAAYVLLAVLISSALVGVVRGWQFVSLRVAGDEALTSSFVGHLTALPLRYFLTRSAGDLMLRLRSIGIVREMLATATLSAVLDGVSALLFLVLLGMLSPVLAAAAAGLAFLELGTLLAVRRRIEHQHTEVLAHQIRTQVTGYQLLTGILMLKALGAEGIAVDRFRTTFAEELAAFRRRTRTSATIEGLMAAVRLGIPVVVLLLASQLAIDGRLSLGSALAASALAAGFAEPFSALSTAIVSLQIVPGNLERIEDVFTVQVPPRADEEAVARRTVEVRDVSFAYSPRARQTLTGISLRLGVGEFVILAGPSGCGKTTLANIVSGLLEPTAGEVRYDDVVVNGAGASVRAGGVGVVAQGSLLFDGSIRDNLTIGDPAAGDATLFEHLDVAGIGEFVRELPLGLDTIVGEGGTSLSGGQAQRIAVARALAGRPALLVLDEATNQLDAVSEARLIANVRATVPTVMLVTHRAALQADADVVVHLDDGRLVEVRRSGGSSRHD